VQVDSSPGAGTTVSIRFGSAVPIAPEDERTIPADRVGQAAVREDAIVPAL
jgi:hypothetical protein